MAKRTPKPIATGDRKYRISELVELSGVTRDMIKYYLRAKLLPKAIKPRRNLSLYTDDHVKLIELIRRYQEQTKLSLPEIATVFRDAKHDPDAIEIELLSGKFSASARDNIIPFEASTHSKVSLNFPDNFIAELQSLGLVAQSLPLEEEEEKKAGLLWAAREAGVAMSFFQSAGDILETLAELEFRALVGVKRSGLDFDDVIESVTDADRIINRWIISEKTAHARRLFKRVLENSEQALSSVHDTIYFPSKVFLQRYNIEQQLAQLELTAAATPGDLFVLQRASRTCLLLTDFERSAALAEQALAIAPDDEMAIACKSLSFAMAGNLDDALLYARRLEAANSRRPIAMEARLLTLLMQAAKLGGVSDTSGLLGEAQQLFLEPLSIASEDEFDLYEARFLEARANTLFPDAINRPERAIEDMTALLQELQTRDGEALGLSFAGADMVMQIYASYYLGQLYMALGDTENARQHFSNVVQLDPASNFGEAAYLQLGQCE